MSEHCRHHVLEHVFNLAQSKRTEYIANKSPVVTSVKSTFVGVAKITVVYNWAYCTACNKGKFVDCNTTGLGIERWVNKHKQCDCRWPEVEHLFTNPKKPIKRVIKVNPLRDKTVGLSEDDREEMERLRNELADANSTVETNQIELERYSNFHTKLITLIEEECDKADKIRVKRDEYEAIDKLQYKTDIIAILKRLRVEIDNGMDEED